MAISTAPPPTPAPDARRATGLGEPIPTDQSAQGGPSAGPKRVRVAFIPLGVWTFGKAERFARRTGRLKRVG